ncbi:cytochrome b [Sphingomonas sp. GB1N7]|uniref:cytochrome b n=1 Tax=Parasphingomonas caseinilytica TaxID=3096158 RepID=UPI002FC5E44E
MDVRRYTKTAMLFHWVIALGILANVALAWVWPYLADEKVRPAIDTHKSIGVTLLGLAVLRVLWRFARTPPAYPASYKGWERTASHVVHWGLYLIIFAMPLTGWIMDSAYKDAASHPMHWFGTFEFPRIGFIMTLDPALRDKVHDGFGAAHGLLQWLLYLLVLVHVAGALKHQMEGEKELQRMWPG